MNQLDQNTIRQFIKDPSDHFDSPAAVVADQRLDLASKRKILESWKVDEQELAKATEENMGRTDSNSLSEVQQALEALDQQ